MEGRFPPEAGVRARVQKRVVCIFLEGHQKAFPVGAGDPWVRGMVLLEQGASGGLQGRW